MGDQFDWGTTGRKTIPQAIPRDEFDRTTHCDTITAVFGDPAVDPRSGGCVGVEAFSDQTRYTPRHLRRTLLKQSWVRWAGGVPASNVSSLEAWEDGQREAASAEHRVAGRLGGRPRRADSDVTDVTAGTGNSD